jgi:tripartite-type tricarboxylate transporter receptor subunit TctC
MLRSILCALIGLTSASAVAAADPIADFYAAHPIVIDVGFAPGGGYDTAARLLARHLGHHMPGHPSVIVRNMPGAGGLLAANHLFNVAPHDGSEITELGDTVPFTPLWNHDGVQFDATKFRYLGSLDKRQSGMAMVWYDAAAKTFADAQHVPVTVGSTGSTDISWIAPHLLNALLGTQFKVIAGYGSTPDAVLAMERGEIDGWLGWNWPSLKSVRPDLVAAHKINVLMQLSSERDPDLKDIPTAFELAKSEGDRRIMRLVFASQELGRIVAAPPGTPEDRLAALRKGFDETMKDPDFLDDAQHQSMSLVPANWQAVDALISDSYSLSPALLARAKEIINSK